MFIEKQPTNEITYIEYSEKIENGKNAYSLHLSFYSSKEAEIYLEKVKQWQLPFEIHGNRITLLPLIEQDDFNLIGVTDYRMDPTEPSKFEDFIFVVFFNESDANAFYTSNFYNFKVKEINKSNMKIQRLFANRPSPYEHFVSFPKSDLIEFSIEKRVKDTQIMIRHMLFCIFSLKQLDLDGNLLPFELMSCILMQFIEPYMNGFSLLNQEVIFFDETKTECFIEYSPVSPRGEFMPCLYLIGGDVMTTKSLFEKLKQNTRLHIDLKKGAHSITIASRSEYLRVKYGGFFNEIQEVGIEFKSSYELLEFLKYVTLYTYTKDNQKILLEPLICQNHLYFKKEHLNLHAFENKIRSISYDIRLIINQLSSNINDEYTLNMQVMCLNQLNIDVRQG